MTRHVLLVLLDKSDPPTHSFVDGLLASRVPVGLGVRVRLMVSRQGDSAAASAPRRYGSATLLPVLRPRRGFGRAINLLAAYRHLRYQVRRETRRGSQVTLFVRNDPVLLLAAKLNAGRDVRLVFQSSFPHEIAANSRSKRIVARLLYRWLGDRVTAVAAVSPLGLQRLERLFPNAALGRWIPLLNDFDLQPSVSTGLEEGPLRFIYVGTHDSKRRLDVVLSAFCRALGEGLDLELLMVGGSGKEIERLSTPPPVENWIEHGRIRFLGHQPRSEIPALLASSDVGISAIPPLAIYQEASPTKLFEYFAAGLPVIATEGIPLQEHFLRESKAGILTSFDDVPLAEAVRRLVVQPAERRAMAQRAGAYGRTVLTYDQFLQPVAELIGSAP